MAPLAVLPLLPLLAAPALSARSNLGVAGTRGGDVHSTPAASLLEATGAAGQRWPLLKHAARAHLALAPRRYGGSTPPARPHAVVERQQPGVPAANPIAAAARAEGTRLFGASRDTDEAFHPRPEGQLERVQMIDHIREQVYGEVEVPPEWAAKFGMGSVGIIHEEQFFEDGREWFGASFRAGLKTDEYDSLIFEVGETMCPKVQRALHINRRLQMLQSLVPMSHVLFSSEVQIFERTTFLLRPYFDLHLEAMLHTYRSREADRTHALSSPTRLGAGTSETDDSPYELGARTSPARSLQMTLDILHGLETLQEAGVVHYDLAPRSIVLIGNRAYISNFGSACVENGGEGPFGVECVGDSPAQLIGSALRHAPEMVGGHPTGPANNVWAAGLILGELLLGELPTAMWLARADAEVHERLRSPLQAANMFEEPELRRQLGWLWQLDSELPGRERLRNLIDDEFDIEESVPEFASLKPQMQHLLRGMLNKDEDERWTAAQAAKEVEKAMKELGFRVQEAAPPLQLPSMWFGLAP